MAIFLSSTSSSKLADVFRAFWAAAATSRRKIPEFLRELVLFAPKFDDSGWRESPSSCRPAPSRRSTMKRHCCRRPIRRRPGSTGNTRRHRKAARGRSARPRHEQAVRPDQVGDGLVLPAQSPAEVKLVALALEQHPAMRLGEREEPLGQKGLVRRLEAEMVAHPLHHEVDVELRRALRVRRVEREGQAERHPAAGFCARAGSWSVEPAPIPAHELERTAAWIRSWGMLRETADAASLVDFEIPVGRPPRRPVALFLASPRPACGRNDGGRRMDRPGRSAMLAAKTGWPGRGSWPKQRHTTM